MNLLSAESGIDFFGIDDSDMTGRSGFCYFDESSSAFEVASSVNVIPPTCPGFRESSLTLEKLFVEEALHGTLGIPSDLRINPNVTKDPAEFPPPGNTPIDNAFLPEDPSSIVWDNGTMGSYILANGALISDWDAEGYGNPRVADHYTYEDPDMGADELGKYVLAGYAPLTTEWADGSNLREWITGSAASGSRGWTTKEVPVPSYRYDDSGETAPGNRPVLTVLPYTLVPISGTFYLKQPFQTAPYSIGSMQPVVVNDFPLSERTIFNLQVTWGTSPIRVSNLQTVIKHRRP